MEELEVMEEMIKAAMGEVMVVEMGEVVEELG